MIIPFSQKLRYLICRKNAPPTSKGEELKRARLQLDWTGSELVVFLGVNEATIYNRENGGAVLRLEHRAKINLGKWNETAFPLARMYGGVPGSGETTGS